MDAEAIRKVLRSLGCENIKTRTKWVDASCPFARWNHEGGTDRHPSFGVTIAPGDMSFFKCQRCNVKGPMYGGFNDLLWQLRSLGMDPRQDLLGTLRHTNVVSPERLRRRMEASTYASGPKEVAGIRVAPKTASQASLFEEEDAKQGIPDSDFEPFRNLPQEALDYLHGPERRLRDLTIQHWEFGFHPKARRVIVPMWDCKERLVNLSGRTILPGCKPKWLHAEGFRRDLYLYGEDRIDFDWKTCYLVEGMFDAAGIWQQGYPNSLAMLGAYISDFQIEKIVRWFDEAVILRDGDAAGKQGAEHSVAKIEGRMRKGARVLHPPEGLDPDQLPLDFLRAHLGDPPLLA